MGLWSERIFAAIPDGHPLVGRQAVYWIDLRDETVLLGTIGARGAAIDHAIDEGELVVLRDKVGRRRLPRRLGCGRNGRS